MCTADHRTERIESAEYQKTGLPADERYFKESELTIYLHKNLSEEDANLVVEKIRQQEGVEILKLCFLRQDSLKEFKSWSGFGEELEILDDNPLPAVVMVKPSKAFNESETS